MTTQFDKYAVKGNEFLNLLVEELQTDEEKALRILKAVLHTLRNHVSVEESLQIIAQLPIVIKGIYVDQWKAPYQTRRIHLVDEFLEEVLRYDQRTNEFDFPSYDFLVDAVRGVFKTLHYYLSDGEFEDIIAVMPAEIKRFIIDSIGYGRIVL